MVGDLALLMIVFSAVVSLFFVFSIRQVLQGRTHSDRIEREGGSLFLSTYLMEFTYWVLNPIAQFCVWLRVSPNIISTFCLLLGFGAGLALAFGDLAMGGWLAVFSSLMDALDGMVARARKVASDAGEVFDAAVDRYAEFAFCFGLLFYYRDDAIGMLLVMLALTGSMMVSYSTAKAEVMQITVPRGLMRRSERAVYLSGAALLAPLISSYLEHSDHPRFYLMQGALLLVGLIANYTAVSRFYYLYKALKK